MAAGAAGLVLLALLVWAVVHTANNSRVPDAVPIPSSSATSLTYTTSSTSSTGYSRPGVQTSQNNPVITGPTESSPSDDRPGDDETTTPSTTTNPYLTTTPTNAGHI